MAAEVDRSPEARARRRPHLFLSHSSEDKPFVRRLAEDLTACGVDAWLDEWELQVGDSLHEVISGAMESSRYIAVVISPNFVSSTWALDELKQSLARERRMERSVVLPLLYVEVEIPAFLEDKIYLDFRQDYHHALTRLAGMIHGLSRIRLEDAIKNVEPESRSKTIDALRYAGHEPYMIIDSQDFEEIAHAGGQVEGDRVRFYPTEVATHSGVSERVRNLMRKIVSDSER